MKWIAAIVMMMTVNTIFSQEAVLEIYPSLNTKSKAAQLSKKLAEPHSGELQKVKSIFAWITENISYRATRSYRVQRRIFANQPEGSLIDDLETLDERVAEKVLESRTAVCDGYARLFKTLCDHAGIRSEIISGYARTGSGRYKFTTNHTWNAVMIDSAWWLLDATWSSGYADWQTGSFYRQYNPDYFLTDPKIFIRDHFPDDPNWALLDESLPLQEFRHSPYRHRSFIKYKITDYFPSKGLIEVNANDSVEIVLQTEDINKDKLISPDLLSDTADFIKQNTVLLSPSSITDKKVVYQYQAVNPAVNTLYIVYNNDIILQYRLRFSKNDREVFTKN